MPHRFTPEELARARAARMANEAARREAANREAERLGVISPAARAIHREAARQVVEEQRLRGRMLPEDRKARSTQVARALQAAGYKTTFDPADFEARKGEHESGKRYVAVEYCVIVQKGDDPPRRIFGDIFFYGSSRAELRAAIFAKEGESEFDTGDVEAVILPDDLDLPE